MLLEMLQQKLQGSVREAFFVIEVHILEDPLKALVGILYGVEGCVEVFSYVGSVLVDIIPESALWDMETMLIGISCDILVVILSQSFLVLLFPDVTDTLEEEKTEDVVLVVGRIYLASEDVRCAPEMGFELLEC